MSIREQIVAKRRARIRATGHTLGAAIPETRGVPLVTFPADPPLICEIKRRSPSRGSIDALLDPVELAGRYRDRGARSISVLTEEDHFAGSLADLVAVKHAYPGLAVLRKDFLLDEEDIRVSHRAGADAVLLIASILSGEELARMHALTLELGMTALVELHDEEDFAKARPVAPPLVGINARDLSTFRVDLLTPVRLRRRIDWPHRAVFESGIFAQEDALLAATSGFHAILVGEAAVRDQNAIGGILRGLRGTLPRQESAPAAGRDAQAAPSRDFWQRLCDRIRDDRPLAKICGITNRDDAELATELGADLLGFVFADSPRRAEPALLEDLTGLPALKVAVVVTGGANGPLADDVRDLLDRGLVDAVQFHGDEEPDGCASQAFPYYRALRLARAADTASIDRYRCPRVLIDARVASGYGGTGARVAPEVVRAAAGRRPLWLAGGLSDENIAEVVLEWRPELVDVSSGLEAAPGRKDPNRLRRFFTELPYGRDLSRLLR